MSNLTVDVAIIGSGFAGSLTASILQSAGLSTALIDRASHPRFAIGESSTPAANLILHDLTTRYGLDRLQPLAKYGPWRREHPNVRCGLKRGFSYFSHVPNQAFASDADHSNQLLVAANSNDETSDTQWHRADVDLLFFHEAVEAGTLPFEQTEVTKLVSRTPGWRVELSNASGPRAVDCAFLIDASGSGRVVGRQLEIADESSRLATNSRAIFAHFEGLPRWEDALSDSCEGVATDHPFPCDDAALHHVFEEGWMWWLRFVDDVTSVGLVLDATRFPLDRTVDPNSELSGITGRYPSVHKALCSSKCVDPARGLVRTSRMQRLAAEITGQDWAMLPHTAGFVDPLHSTGIAHSLAGVERLTDALITYWGSHELPGLLDDYATTTRSELLLIDELVSLCYAAIRIRSFRKLNAATMCYFAAATSWERRRLAGHSPCPALLCADDARFREVMSTIRSRIDVESDESFECLCMDLLGPYNQVGLFRSPIPNMYAATALPESEAD